MNKVILIGRLTSDPVLRENETSKQVKFTLAVNRLKEGADFINCIAWNKTAELISKYFKKGSQLAIEGRINTGSYEKDGKKIYTTDVVVENITFIGTGDKTSPEEKKEENRDLFKEFSEEVDIDSVLPF